MKTIEIEKVSIHYDQLWITLKSGESISIPISDDMKKELTLFAEGHLAEFLTKINQ
jgi:hypothetical protein